MLPACKRGKERHSGEKYKYQREGGRKGGRERASEVEVGGWNFKGSRAGGKRRQRGVCVSCRERGRARDGGGGR